MADEFPSLSILPPSTVAATPERTYADTWCKSLEMIGPVPAQPTRLQMVLAAYDKATQTLSPKPEATQMAVSSDLYADAALYPKLKDGLVAFLGAIDLYGPVLLLRSQIMGVENELAQYASALLAPQKALANAQKMPDSSPVKAPAIQRLTAQVTALQTQMQMLNSQLSDLTAKLTAAETALGK